MKLILCVKCSDVFKLSDEKYKTCDCGMSGGEYVNTIDAEVSGPCIVLGFSNHSLLQAIRLQTSNGDRMDKQGREFDAFIIPECAPSVKRLDEIDVYKDFRK